MEKTNLMKTISVIPFSSEVIGADDEYVYIKEIDSNEGDWPPCVIKLTKEQFPFFLLIFLKSE